MGSINDHMIAGLGGTGTLNDRLIAFFSGLSTGTTGQVLTKQADGTNQYAAAAGGVTWPLDNTGATAATDAVTLDVTGDTNLRFVLNQDGSQEWGSGSAAADLTFARSAARTGNLTGRFVLTGSNTGDIQFVINGPSGQTANLQQWQVNSSVVASIRNDGYLTAPGVLPPSGSDPYLTAGTTWALNGQATTANLLLALKASTGQTADIQQWGTNAVNNLFAVTAAGLPKWSAAGNQQTTVGAAGGASALPATPTKYLKIVDSAGTTLVIPAYAAS